MNSKPNIVDVIERYTSLRKCGQEFIGLAPCHDDHHPSLRVNPDKGVWFCDPCGHGGDVITFIELVENVSFGEACEILRMERCSRTARRQPRRASALLARWLNEQYLLVGARCRDLAADISIADEMPDRQLSVIMQREFEILSDLHDDLANPAFAAEFWAVRESIEQLTTDVELEPELRSFLQC